MPVFDPGVPWLRGTATLTNGSTTVETDGVITLNEILEGDRLYVMDGGQRIGPLEIVGGENDEIELREAFEGETGSYAIAIDRNPITRTGAKTLRDVADILARIGNFGELSERDQIGADLIPIGPERDAIKDALDVTKRASNLADLSNLKEARSNLGSFSSVAEVQSRHIPAVLESIRTFGRTAPGDGPPLDLVRGYEAPGAVQSADGQWWEDVGYNTITVRIPIDFDTIQDALDHYSRLPLRRGAILNMRFVSGHQPDRGLIVSNDDYGRFLITSEDAVLSVHDSFSGPFITASSARVPELGCLVDMRGLGGVGYDLSRSCVGYVQQNCGVINAGTHGAEVRTSRVYALNTLWTGAGGVGIRIQQATIASFQGADASGAQGDTGVYVSRGSILNFMSGKAANCAGNGMLIRRSKVAANSADLSNAGSHALEASQGSQVTAREGADVSGAGGYGVFAGGQSEVDAAGLVAVGTQLGVRAMGGSSVNLEDGEVTGTLGAPDLRVGGGASINATNCVTTNSSSSSPDTQDTNVVFFNTPSKGGIIWDDGSDDINGRSSAPNTEEFVIDTPGGFREVYKGALVDLSDPGNQTITFPAPLLPLPGYGRTIGGGNFTDSPGGVDSGTGGAIVNSYITTTNDGWIFRCSGGGSGTRKVLLWAKGATPT